MANPFLCCRRQSRVQLRQCGSISTATVSARAFTRLASPNHVYPEAKDWQPTKGEAQCTTRDRSWSKYFFDQGAGNRLKGVEGTLWAAYNGVTEWLDYRKIRQSADQRLASIWVWLG